MGPMRPQMQRNLFTIGKAIEKMFQFSVVDFWLGLCFLIFVFGFCFVFAEFAKAIILNQDSWSTTGSG